MTDVTIITATVNRPKHLALLIEQVKRQRVNSLSIEHLVVSDGPCKLTQAVCEHYETTLLTLPEKAGQAGAACKDHGIQHASGEYVVFWDDDNHYEDFALAVLYATASGHDCGVCQVKHRAGGFRVIPPHFDRGPEYGKIDSACFCVRSEIAKEAPPWADNKGGGTDIRWIGRVHQLTQDFRFVPVVIGSHL